MSQHRIPTLAHVVYRTRNFEQMLAWYQEMFHARVQHQNPVMAFLTYDGEHHRLAFIDLAAVQPDGAIQRSMGWLVSITSPTPTRHWKTFGSEVESVLSMVHGVPVRLRAAPRDQRINGHKSHQATT